ncbi:hypothetical protein FRC10_000470 [Ceratobasidium sp. 414]|nr:hypothetical protein FRC10_000470 [Ceratobasidium sp. 414]
MSSDPAPQGPTTMALKSQNPVKTRESDHGGPDTETEKNKRDDTGIDTGEAGRDNERLYQFYPDLKTPVNGQDQCFEILLHSAAVSGFAEKNDNLLYPMQETIAVALNTTNQIMSRATGATIYMIASWDDGEGGTQVYESCSDRLKGMFQEDDTRKMRSAFLRRVHAELDWQDIELPAWADIDNDVKSKKFLIVSKERLPEGMNRFDHPGHWPEPIVRLMGQWIRRGQRWLDERNEAQFKHVFQWSEPDCEGSLRLRAQPDCEMTYDYDGATYFASMSKFKFRDDAYIPSSTGTPLISDEARQIIVAESLLCSAVVDTMKLVQEYETFQPPQREPLDSDPMLFRHFDFQRSSLVQHLKAPRLPDGFCRWMNVDHKYWHVSDFVVWVIHTGALIDATTGKVYGGHNGVLRLLVGSILMLKSMRWTRQVKEPNDIEIKRYTRDDERQVAVLLSWVISNLKASIDRSTPVQPTAIPPGHRGTCRVPKQIRWFNNMNGAGTDDPCIIPGGSVAKPPWFPSPLLTPQADQIIDVDMESDDGAVIGNAIVPLAPAPLPENIRPDEVPEKAHLQPIITSGRAEIITGDPIVPRTPVRLQANIRPNEIPERSHLEATMSSRRADTDSRAAIPLPQQQSEAETSRRSHSEPRSGHDQSAPLVNALHLDVDRPPSEVPSPQEAPLHDLDDPSSVSFGPSVISSTPVQRGRPTMKQMFLDTTIGSTEGGQARGSAGTSCPQRRVMESVEIPVPFSGHTQIMPKAGSTAMGRSVSAATHLVSSRKPSPASTIMGRSASAATHLASARKPSTSDTSGMDWLALAGRQVAATGGDVTVGSGITPAGVIPPGMSAARPARLVTKKTSKRAHSNEPSGSTTKKNRSGSRGTGKP